MISFFLLLAYCQCSQRRYSIRAYSLVSPLDSFGFEQNATFDISVATRNKTRLIIFLATFDEMKARIVNEIAFSDICLNPRIHLSVLNSTFKTQTIFRWRGVIKSTNIYYPYILNCNQTKSLYTVLTNFTNPNSHLDLRDELYPYFNTGLSYVYLTLTAICLLNFLIYQSFGILIPPILACITSIKAMVMSSYAQIWIDRRLGIVNYDYYGNYLFNFIYLIYYTAFFSFPTFIIAGWSVYRNSIPFFEALIIIRPFWKKKMFSENYRFFQKKLLFWKTKIFPKKKFFPKKNFFPKNPSFFQKKNFSKKVMTIPYK